MDSPAFALEVMINPRIYSVDKRLSEVQKLWTETLTVLMWLASVEALQQLV